MLPIAELGGTLFGAGVLGTLFEYSFRKDQEEAPIGPEHSTTCASDRSAAL